MPDNVDSWSGWCIFEAMGHVKITGEISTIILGGASLLRIDVPETSRYPGYTQLYGLDSVYRITLVDEAIARAMAERSYERSVTRLSLPQLTAPVYDRRGEDDDPDDDDD
jgi:hypothetical protein